MVRAQSCGIFRPRPPQEDAVREGFAIYSALPSIRFCRSLVHAAALAGQRRGMPADSLVPHSGGLIG